MISGASLYKAAEIVGHRASALKNNASYRFTSPSGESGTAHFIDNCNGHPTPANAGNSYHYHGLSPCVTAQVDEQGGPSHLIGVALDGFPIYGDRDIDGRPAGFAMQPHRRGARFGRTSHEHGKSVQGRHHHLTLKICPAIG